MVSNIKFLCENHLKICTKSLNITNVYSDSSLEIKPKTVSKFFNYINSNLMRDKGLKMLAHCTNLSFF